MAAFTEPQLEFFYNFPSWVIACWAVAVFGSVIGSLLLLFRMKLATIAFGGSLLAMIATSIHNFGMSNGLEIMGTVGVIFTGVIFLVAVFEVVYSQAMVNKGIIK